MPKRQLTFLSKCIIFVTLPSLLNVGLQSNPVWADDEIYSLDYSSLSVPMSPTSSRWAYQLINSAEANAAGLNGNGVTVALLDNGIDQRVIGISSKVIGRFDATHSVSGYYDHGTATSSIVAADPVPEAGIGGVAPRASILDVRVCLNTNCRTEWIVDGLKWAIDHGANVISMSLGGGQTIEPATAHLIKTAISQGIVVVAAAGNNACVATYTSGNQTLARNCTQSSLPYSYPGSQSIAGLVTVGAIGRDLTRNSYSNYGAYVDLVAPGSDVATNYPWGPNAYFAGTSAAAPVVAGISALIKQAAPSATPEQVQAILQSTTTDPIASIPEVWESCTYINSLWDCLNKSPARWPTRFYTGAGVVNAQQAVAMATQLQSGNFQSGLVATSQDSAIALDWSATSLGSGPYKIFVDGKQIIETPDTTFQITGLTNSSQYAIQISDSANLKTIPQIATPGAEVSIQTPTISNPETNYNSVYLRVANEPNLNYGVLIFANGDQAPCTRSGSSLRFDCSYVVSTTPISGTFKLIDSQGNFSAHSNSLTWNYTGFAAPNTVNVTVVSETEVSASWNALSGASYYCYYDAGAGAWVPTTSTSVQISGVRPGLPQTFSVFASTSNCNASGLTSPTYWYLPFGPALSAPSELAMSNLTSSGVDINFQAPIGADRYAIYRSDGKNWITATGVTYVSDIFASADYGKTFTYWITAIDDVQYGSQYGAISNSLLLTVPTPSVQNVTGQLPSVSSGGSSAGAPPKGFVPPSNISINPSLRTNSISLSPSAKQIKIGASFKVTGRSKSGSRVTFSVSGPCAISKNSINQVTIRGTDIGNCQVYALTASNLRFNAAEKFLTIPVGYAFDSMKLSGTTRANIGKEFRIAVVTKSKKPINWTVTGSCVLTAQTNTFAVLRATAPAGNCLIEAVTTEDGKWSVVGSSKRVAIH